MAVQYNSVVSPGDAETEDEATVRRDVQLTARRADNPRRSKRPAPKQTRVLFTEYTSDI